MDCGDAFRRALPATRCPLPVARYPLPVQSNNRETGNLGNEAPDDGFDLIDVVATASEESEEATS